MVFQKRDLFVTDLWEFDFPYHSQFKSQILDYIRSDVVQDYIKQCSSSNPSVSCYGGHEITFQDNCPEIYNSLFQTIYTIGNQIFLSIWNRHVNGGGNQIANYNI